MCHWKLFSTISTNGFKVDFLIWYLIYLDLLSNPYFYSFESQRLWINSIFVGWIEICRLARPAGTLCASEIWSGQVSTQRAAYEHVKLVGSTLLGTAFEVAIPTQVDRTYRSRWLLAEPMWVCWYQNPPLQIPSVRYYSYHPSRCGCHMDMWYGSNFVFRVVPCS